MGQNSYLKMSLGSYSVISCKKDFLGEEVIPNGVKKIGRKAFRGCTFLTSIKVHDSVTMNGIMAFDGCSSLNDIHFKHWTSVDFSDAFSGLDKSKITFYVPKGSDEAYRIIVFYKKGSKDRMQERYE